ncbi:GET complex subunit get1 [Gonapodya sp. JEL0774]|nr:GET complex subunit get1 [Gonapodya sp. JEL0774]
MGVLESVLLISFLLVAIESIGYSTIISFLWSIYSFFSSDKSVQIIAKLKAEIVKLRKDLANTSSQDEFAKWAKIRRRLDAATADLQAKCESESVCVSVADLDPILPDSETHTHTHTHTKRQRNEDEEEDGMVVDGGEGAAAQAEGERDGEGEVVVQHQPEKRSRLDTNNVEIKQRSKRLFGQLLGTLNKFKEQSGTKSEAQIRREEFEARLAEKLAKEKAELASKVAVENEERRKAREEHRKKEDQERRVALNALHRRYKSNMSNFVKTKADPPIYYLPAKLTDPILELLAAQKRELALETLETTRDGEGSPKEGEANGNGRGDHHEDGDGVREREGSKDDAGDPGGRDGEDEDGMDDK